MQARRCSFDYAGPTIALIEHGQEVGRANIFVAAMAASGYSFAMATPRQTDRKSVV